jgi:hypothetical protein
MQNMKLSLKISIWLNLGLLGGLIFVVLIQRKEETAVTSRAIAEAKPSAQPAIAKTTTAATRDLPKPFRWSQLESTNDYRIYVANLHAIGCPEPTIRDIVSGDAERAFAFKRNQLGLDGTGTGAWSRLHEAQMVAGLLGEQTLVAENAASVQSGESGSQQNGGSEVAENSAPAQSLGQTPNETAASAAAYPLVFQKINMDALGLNADQKAAIGQVQQQFVNDIGGPNQNPDDPAYLTRWQKAQSDADDMVRGLLGNEAYMAYLQQQYYAWYQPQVQTADSESKPLTINPDLFSIGK